MKKRITAILTIVMLMLSLLSTTVLAAIPPLFKFGFEAYETAWTMIDADGDGYNFFIPDAPIKEYYSIDASQGDGMLVSGSYFDHGESTALEPDNYAVSPKITLPEKEELYLNYDFAIFNSSYSKDTYSVYVYSGNQTLTKENIAQLAGKPIYTETPSFMMDSKVYEPRSIDISDYAGQDIQIILRNYDSFDQYFFMIDNITIKESAIPTPEILYVGEVEVNESNADDILGDGKVSFDFETKTLTLNNANITSSYLMSSGERAAIYSTFDINVNLIGNNTIALGGYIVDCVYWAFVVRDNLYINGKGKLTITDQDDDAIIEEVAVAKSSEIYIAEDTTVKANFDNENSLFWINTFVCNNYFQLDNAKVEAALRGPVCKVLDVNDTAYIIANAKLDIDIFCTDMNYSTVQTSNIIIGDNALLDINTAESKYDASAIYTDTLCMYGDAQLNIKTPDVENYNTGIDSFEYIDICDNAKINVEIGNGEWVSGIFTPELFTAGECVISVKTGDAICLDDCLHGDEITDPDNYYEKEHQLFGLYAEAIHFGGGNITAQIGEAPDYEICSSNALFSNQVFQNNIVNIYAKEISSDTLKKIVAEDMKTNNYRYVEMLSCDGGDDCLAGIFKDVSGKDWFHDAVDFAVANSLMNGVAPDRFAPNNKTTREQLVTILWRLCDEPEPKTSKMPFGDVDENRYSAEAIMWAAENEIVNGVAPEKFAPQNNLTREQLVTIFYRFINLTAEDGIETDTQILNLYDDANKVSEYAKEAMSWAIETGIVTGTTPTTLAPKNNATRAQIATIIMRFMNYVAG